MGQPWSAMTWHYNAEIEKDHLAQYDSSHYSEDNPTICNNNPINTLLIIPPTHWHTIDTLPIWNVRVCDTVLRIGIMCVEILLRVSFIPSIERCSVSMGV